MANQTIIYQISKEDLESIVFSMVAKFTNEIAQEKEDKETLLSVSSTCAMLGVNRSTLWRWEKEHYLTPLAVGKKKLYRKQDINNLMLQR